MRFKFILNTAGVYFAGWLDIRTSRDERDGKLKLPTEDGWIVLQHALSPFSSSPRPSITQRFIMPMYITEVMQSGDLRDDIMPIPTTIGILFTVVPLTPERIQVIADRRHPAAIDYFNQLLAEIGKLWPEAEKRLEAKPERVPEEPIERQKRARKHTRPHMEQRRQRVLNFSKRGLLVSEIAGRVGCSESTVKRDRRWLTDEGSLL